MRDEVLALERCTCGHLRGQHADTFGKGHGACIAAGPGRRKPSSCRCEKFSWAEPPPGGYEAYGAR